MGTVVSIELADSHPAAQLTGMIGDVCAWLHEVDARFSTYKPDSEVNRFQRRELALDDCSPDMRHVLDACADLWRETEGYFDAYASGPLDPSGYVKGWSVEVASARLAAAGSTRHYINAGGDIRMRGLNSEGEAWRVGIRHPWEADKLSWVLALTDGAVASSGRYERGDHVRNPLRRILAIAAPAAMDVVGHDADQCGGSGRRRRQATYQMGGTKMGSGKG